MRRRFNVNTNGLVALLCFFTVCPVLLICDITVAGAIRDFVSRRLNVAPPPHTVLSLVLVINVVAVIHFNRRVVIGTVDVLMFPFINMLVLLTLCLVPR